jgi:hypothetical protein
MWCHSRERNRLFGFWVANRGRGRVRENGRERMEEKSRDGRERGF